MARAQQSGSHSAKASIPERTFVLDNGASTLKAGFASQSVDSDAEALQSCAVIPNCIVRSRERKVYVASQVEEITQWSEAVFRRPVEHGQVVNWEAQKEIWDYSFFDQASAGPKTYVQDPAGTTLIYAETPNAMPALQKNTDEIVMEEWEFGGYLRVVGPSLNAYNDLNPAFEDPDMPKAQSNPVSSAVESLLVVDSGFSFTTITPCFEGRPIQRAIRRLDFGGKHLTNLLKETVSVRYFDLHQDTKIVNDIKEDVCFVSADLKADLEKAWKGNKTKPVPASRDVMDIDQSSVDTESRIDYVLPDGVNLTRGYLRPHDPSKAAEKRRKLALSQPDSSEIVMTLNNERFTIPELLFSPADIGSKQPGIVECIVQALSKLPPLIQAAMVSHVLVVGGNANIPGFAQRIEDELRAKVRSEWPVRVRSMQDPVTSSWLGGSRMASHHREHLQRLAISREQYQEYGSSWLARHFAETR